MRISSTALLSSLLIINMIMLTVFLYIVTKPTPIEIAVETWENQQLHENEDYLQDSDEDIDVTGVDNEVVDLDLDVVNEDVEEKELSYDDVDEEIMKLYETIGCSIELPERAFDIPDNIPRLPKQVQEYLRDNPDKLSVEALNLLVPKEFVDIDNSISTELFGKDLSSIRVSYLNAQRGTYWCQLAKLILEDSTLRETDFWVLNEFDLGAARTQKEYTLRQFAYALGMNYAFGLEFLELSPGNKEEWELVENLNLSSTFSMHGNAILSRYPINRTFIARPPGIELLYKDEEGSFYTAGGFEHRLGGRMTLLASIDVSPSQSFTVGAIHMQAHREDDDHVRTTSSLTKQGIKVVDPEEQNQIIIGGDTWERTCNILELEKIIPRKSGYPSKKTGTWEVNFTPVNTDFICVSSGLTRSGSHSEHLPIGVNSEGQKIALTGHLMLSSLITVK